MHASAMHSMGLRPCLLHALRWSYWSAWPRHCRSISMEKASSAPRSLLGHSVSSRCCFSRAIKKKGGTSMDHSPQDPEAALPRFLLPKDLDGAEQPTSPLVKSVIQQR